MKKHLYLLDKKDLRTSGWTTRPLDNLQHNFVGDLLSRYMEDLETRMD